jgi:hypothetical protein
MARPFSKHERYRLLSTWCDGSISDAELEQLDEALRTDPEFRRFFLSYMDQHAVLTADLLAIGDPVLTKERLTLRLVDHEPIPAAPATPAVADGEMRGNPPGRLDRAPHSWHWWIVPVLAFAAVLLIGLTVALWPKGRREAPTASGSPPRSAPPRLSPANDIAVVIQLVRVEWERGAGQEPSEGDTLPASRLVFRSGQITLSLVSGVTLTVEGPADLDLLSIDRVHCRRGKLRTRVPHGAEGFVVSGPSSAVVDLGTEFALNVASDGKAQLMVFEGAAEAAVLNASGSPLQIHQITEHQAFEIDPGSGQIEEAEARGEDFVRSPVLSIPPLSLDPTYHSAVMAARPWGYWRFETMDGGAVPCEVAERPPLRATGPVRLTARDAQNHNRCAVFGPDKTEQSLELDGLWKPPDDPGYAVELWVLPEQISHAALASLIEPGPPNDDYKHLFLLELTTSDRQSLLPPASVRFLHRWPPGDSGGENVFSTRYYIPYRWHHLVAQKSGSRMELFMDGASVPPVSIRAERATEACRLLVGRLKPEPRLPGQVHSRPFVGRIDEIALYDHPLSAEEIQRHSRLGAPGGRSTEP